MKQNQQALQGLLQELHALAAACSDLGAGLSRAATELEESRVLPSERLVEDIVRIRRGFAELHARGLELAQSLPGSPPLAPGEILSLSDLESWLRTRVDAAEAEEKRLATEEVRHRALMVLDRVLALAHCDGIEFPPLRECQARARDLHLTISEAKWSDLPPDTDALAEGKHPFAVLLTLVEHLGDLDDDQFGLLWESVTDSFGKPLATAASRGKVRIQPGTPVKGGETAFPVEQLEPVAPPVAPEPLAVVTSSALPETLAPQEADATLTTAPAETLEEGEVEVETRQEAPAAEPVEEAEETERPLRQEVVAVYLQLRGYTDFASTRKPEEVMGVLTEYHDQMGSVILAHEGSLHALADEDMIVLFSDLVPTQAENAIRMAVAMRDRVGELAVKWRRQGYKLDFCLGIAQGSATTDREGRLNSEDIDAVVDLASRLARGARPAQIWVSQTFLAMVEKLVEAERGPELALPGRDRPVTTYKFLRLAPLVGDAPQAGQGPRVGYLEAGSLSAHPREAFQQGLRELGYVEGQNIAIEYRAAEGKRERLAHLAAELVQLKVDVIFAVSLPAILAAKNATRTIPIVFLGAVDPVASGFVASLARPGGNLTGLTLLGPALSGKRLELLKEAVPEVSRVAILWNPANATAAPMFKETEVAVRPLRLQLQPLGVRDPAEFDSAFSVMTRQRAAALIVLPDPMFYSHKRRIVDLVAKHRLPAMYYAKDYVEAGGLMSYGASFPDLLRRAATYVDRILKGAKPADLPVEQPTKFELVINLKTAKALGLTIPQSVLIGADHVVE